MADQTTWPFQGPFTKDLYDQIHQQAALAKSSGGKDDLNDSLYASRYGVRSRFPRSTPKYVRYNGVRHHEFLDTTARMYIQARNPDAFVRGVSKDKNLESIARVLVGYHAGEERKNGQLIKPAVNKGGKGYIDFFLQQANHQLNEKMQVIETLSDNYVAFFFGQQAPIFQYSGSLMNTYQDDWTINMVRLFQHLGRGSQLARRGVLFYLKYDSMVVSGSLCNFNWTLSGDVEVVSPFSFSLLVRKIHILYNGLEPATDFTLDNTIDILNQSLFPDNYSPNESGNAAVQGKIHDNLEGDTTYGASNGTSVTGGSSETPTKTAEGSPSNGDGAGSEEEAAPAGFTEEQEKAYQQSYEWTPAF